MTPVYANVIALAIGFAFAVALAATGTLKVAKMVRALKERGESYKHLPVKSFVADAQVKVAKMERRIETAPALAYRFKAALSEIANARAKVLAIATSPRAVWRLGELIVTGR